MRIQLMLLILLLLSSAYALEVYVRPPRMVARINLTETNEWRGFIEVKNSNNFTVNVTFKPVGNITDKISIIDQVQLKPGELRQENFTLKVDKPGIYQGGVIVTYSGRDEVPVALQADIIIIASGEKPKQFNYVYLVLPLLALTALIGFIAYKRVKG
jgi:hypothetical protein